jgi:hypothetical protein
MPADRIPVACVAKWTTGATGTFTCIAGGPNKGNVQLTNDNVHLDRICVSDSRLTTYGFGNGQTASIDAKGDPPGRCGTFGGVARLPESCSCTASDCTPPKEGFVCFAAGYVQLGGH